MQGIGKIKFISGTIPFSFFLVSSCILLLICGIVFVPDNLTSSSQLLLPKPLPQDHNGVLKVSPTPDNLTWTRC